MNKTKLKGTCKTAPQLLVTTEDLKTILSCGRVSALKIGQEAKGRRWETGTLECGKDTAVLK